MLNTYGGICQPTFSCKAGAMYFAILFCAKQCGKVDYDETKKLFDFICSNVTLPDVEKNPMEDIAGLGAKLSSLLERKQAAD